MDFSPTMDDSSALDVSFTTEVTPSTVVSYYTDLIENHAFKLRDHLSDDAVLYWYGRTIRGKELVNAYFIEEIDCPEHKINSVRPLPEITYRSFNESETINIEENETNCPPVTSSAEAGRLLDSVFESPSRDEDLPGRTQNESGLAPLDCSLAQNTPDLKMTECQKNTLMHRPRKPQYNLRARTGVTARRENRNFVEAKGSILFWRIGKHGCERQWSRECRLQLAYSCPLLDTDPLSSIEFSLIIYGDDMKCRRNLNLEFDKIKICDEEM